MNKQTSFTHALAIHSLTDTCLVLGQLYTPSHVIGVALQIESSTIFMTKMMLGDAASIECHVKCANKCTNCEHWHVVCAQSPKHIPTEKLNALRGHQTKMNKQTKNL